MAAITTWYAVRSQFAVAELARLRKEIDRAESELQTALDREKQQFGLVHEAFGRASTVALYHPADPAIQGLADNLKRLVEEFKVHASTKPLSDADGRRLRIAEGLVANAESAMPTRSPWSPSRTQPRPSPGPGPRSSKPLRRTRCVRMPSMGCDGGETPWPTTAHPRIAPDDRSAALSAGNCFLFLGQLKEALDKYGQVITPLVRLVEQEGAPSWPMTSLAA